MYNIEDIRNKILCGDSLTELKKIPSESVNMIITSPPYWALRDYKTEPIIFGGVSDCKHVWVSQKTKFGNMGGGESKKEVTPEYRDNLPNQNFCSLCGAWKGQLGLEPDFRMYINNLCDIFDECKRILKPSGTCWINIADTYYTKSGTSFNGSGVVGGKEYVENCGLHVANKIRGEGLLPSKSLVGIPERLSLEMMNRGWIKRNTIIWYKRNCMPVSVKDRFTQDFEYLYFFVKDGKYYFEQQFEPLKEISIKRSKYGWNGKKLLDGESYNGISPTEEMGTRYAPESGRNKRCVWDIPSKGFKGAHFATFPESLIETPILAGCPELVCKKCGTPKQNVYGGKSSDAFNIRVRDVKEDRIKHIDRKASEEEISEYDEKEYGGEGRTLLGYRQCDCGVEFTKGIVLDPFMGAGTVGVVCKKLNRDFIGIELNPEYVSLSNERIRKIVCQPTLLRWE